MYSTIQTYHEQLGQLTEQLREVGHLGLVLIDAVSYTHLTLPTTILV